MELTEIVHFVKGLAPAADRWNTDPSTDRVHLKNSNKAVFIVQQAGGTTGKATLTMEAHAAASSGTPEAIAFSYRVGAAGASAGGDAIGALQQATAAGFDTTAATDRLYFLEIRGDQLPDGKPWVSVKGTEAANDPVDGCITIALYELREQGAVLPTAIA